MCNSVDQCSDKQERDESSLLHDLVTCAPETDYVLNKRSIVLSSLNILYNYKKETFSMQIAISLDTACIVKTTPVTYT